MNSRPLTSYRVIKYFGGEISVTDLLSPQSHSSGRVLFKWPRTSRRFLILSWSASIWNLMTKWVTWKRCAWVFWCQVYSMSFVHSPPGPHSSYGLSRLWRTDRFLFHSGHCHSSRWNPWEASKKKNTHHTPNSNKHSVYIFRESAFLLVGNFHRVWISHSVGIVRQHFLRTVIRAQIKLWVVWVVVTLWDDAAADSWLIVCLKVDIIDLTLELNRQRPGLPGVNKARPITWEENKILESSNALLLVFYQYSIFT